MTDKNREEEIFDILSVSQRNNEKYGVTGMLLYINYKFIQFIEGEKDIITHLYKIIIRDSRNYANRVLCEGEISERFFRNWTMGFKALTENDLNEWAALNNVEGLSVELLLNESTPHIAIEILKSFYGNGELNYEKFWKGL